MPAKTTSGRFFEDFTLGQRLVHAVPRTLHGGDLALYMALTGDRRPLSSSTELARSLGFFREVVQDLLAFHVVFGKSVPDISVNATANLGYADVRFLRPVYPGDTLFADSEVIGLRPVSSGDAGVVYVATRGVNQKGQDVLSYVRWVLVPKRDAGKPVGEGRVPRLPDVVPVERLPVPDVINLQRFPDLAWATGGRALWDDYEVGERIVHGGAMTIEEADHGQATRLYHNTARVHFDGHGMASSRFGRRLVYGGHVISVAYALAFDGLENVLRMAAWNGGVHANPTFAGDTISAWTEIVERAELPGKKDLGALRMKLYAVKNTDLATETVTASTTTDGKPSYDPRVVLALDWWGLVPRRM
jgi:2-methylfumaryl-CoA hydratase